MSTPGERPKRAFPSFESKGNGSLAGSRDDLGSKSGEEAFSTVSEDDIFKKFSRESSFHFEGVRFTPRVIEFLDAFQGKQFSVKIRIQNIGKNPVKIRVGEPKSFIFQLKKPIRCARLLAAGSSLTRTITYSFHSDDLVQKSQIPIQINGRNVDYPIVVKKAQAEIEVHPPKLDFKVINMGASAKTLILTIRNTGARRTRFEIDIGKNDLELVVHPTRGIVRAKDEETIRVEMMGTAEGEFYKEMWVTTSEAPIRVPVLVEVVRPRLEFIYPKGTEDFTLMNFRPTFNGTQRAGSFVLKNYSAETTLFIILAEVNGELEFLADAKKKHTTFGMFQLTAEEGRLEPFECRIVTVLFRPKVIKKKKGWHHEECDKKKKTQWEHIVFLRVNRVHCIERKELAKVEGNPASVHKEKSVSMIQSFSSITADHAKNTTKTSDYLSRILESDSLGRINSFLGETTSREVVLRICLHGKAVEPEIVISPSRFAFSKLIVGEKKDRVVRIANASTIPLKFKFCKTMNVHVIPNEGWLQPEEAQEFLVTLLPSCAGKFRTKLMINFMAQSDVVFDNDKNMMTVATSFVTIMYSAQNRTVHPKPKIHLGITKVAQGQDVTFKNGWMLPYGTMLQSLKKSTMPEWMKKEADPVNKVDNALVAVPNDRPKAIVSGARDKIYRTIFKGFFRYVPPQDISYTFIAEQLTAKKRDKALWNDYLRSQREGYSAGSKDGSEEYPVSCKRHTNMEQYKPNLTFVSMTRNKEEFKKYLETIQIPLEGTLVPLSPMFLSTINVEPKFINFETVAANTLVEETLTVNNMNPFSISIQFVPGKSAVLVLEGDTIAVQSFTTRTLKIGFTTKDLGRYYGYLNYVINGSHEFKITISAFVTSKTLDVKLSPGKEEEDDPTLEFGDYPPRNAFQPRNLFIPLENCLQSPIRYRWVIPRDSIYATKIVDGEVPARSQILTEFTFNLHPKKNFYTELGLVSESGTSAMIKLIYRPKKAAVSFVSSRIEVPDIPLNLPTTTKAILQNDGYTDVAFDVADGNPMPGVTVEPRQGIVKARSFFSLFLNLQIPVVMEFSFEVVLQVQFSNRISVKVSGNVVAPVIRLKPAEVEMRKICAHSIDTAVICAENVGTTTAELEVDFSGYPEYRVEENMQKISLEPKEFTKIMIHFEPKDVARQVFYFPIVINNILGPPMLQERNTEFYSFYISRLEEEYQAHGNVASAAAANMKLPCIVLSSLVSPSRLKISPLNVAFKKGNGGTYQSQAIVFSNEFVDDVTFCIRNDDLGEDNGSPFNLTPAEPRSVEYRMKSLKASLRRGEEMTLMATFQPKKPGAYDVEIPVFVRGYNNGVVYNYIRMKGELKEPRVYPEATEIHFPPLPLDVPCDVTLNLCASNCERGDRISCIFWDSRGVFYGPDCLTFSWVTEPVITVENEMQVFQLQVTFQSSVPLALKGYLVFLDAKGGYSSVLVTGVSDNCSITTHAFLSTRSSKYKLVRTCPPSIYWPMEEEVILTYPVNRVFLNPGKTKEARAARSSGSSHETSELDSSKVRRLDKGPRLVLLGVKPVQLNFVNVAKSSPECRGRGSNLTLPSSIRSRLRASFTSRRESFLPSRAQSLVSMLKKQEVVTDVTYPNFSFQETSYGTHLQETLNYVERWLYEVVLHCDQYFTIPDSFQVVKEQARRSKASAKGRVEKDFLNVLEDIVGPDASLPERVSFNEKDGPAEKAESLYAFYSEVLRFLQSHGCLLPHVRPEYLVAYENYSLLMKTEKTVDTFRWSNPEPENPPHKNPKEAKGPKEEISQDGFTVVTSKVTWKKSLFDLGSDLDLNKNDESKVEADEDGSAGPIEWDPARQMVEGRKFAHRSEPLDKFTFRLKSTQAWLDVLVQIFRTFVLAKFLCKNTIPQVSMIDMSDRIPVEFVELFSAYNPAEKKSAFALPHSLESNVYSTQERALLTWLNHHLLIQRGNLWQGKKLSEMAVCNFDKDLSNSIALMSVTASHCPYVVSKFFGDVFAYADTPNKVHHNAGKLVLAWRELNIGLSVETSNIVTPNPVFMGMLLVQLYEVLPTLHPRSLLYFSAPLNKEVTRVIQLKNDTCERLVYESKFMGEDGDLFRLSDSPLIEVASSKTKDIKVTFAAKKIKKGTATLILSGHVVSPGFGRSLVFYLEGEPSLLAETQRLSLTAPLYEVICTEVVVKPPFSEPTTYDIWYTTEHPQYIENVDISCFVKPWSKICNRKISRRLFLSQSTVEVKDENGSVTLGLTVACITEEDRSFWLIFRSSTVGDFIVLIQIKAKPAPPQGPVPAFYSEQWSPSAECLCRDKERELVVTRAPGHGCPLITEIKIPRRNDALWKALLAMLFKALQPEEKAFWAEHFETNIGLCLVLWLLSPDEEEEIVDEFVHVLPTKVSYALAVEPPESGYFLLPEKIEIPDVRERSFVGVPVHVAEQAPEHLTFTLTMTSESGKEVRSFRVSIQPSGEGALEVQATSSPVQIPRFFCQASRSEPCKRKKKKKLKNIKMTPSVHSGDR